MPQRYRKIKINGKTRQLSRHLMEQHLGRKLRRDEIVHHKNHDKLDDRLDNYELTTPKDHMVHHNQKHPLSKKCAVCGKDFTPHPTKRARQVTCSRECFRTRLSQAAAAQMAASPPVFAKLTPVQAEEIRRLYAAGGETHRSLGAKFNVNHGTIGAVVRGKSWTKWAS